MMRPAIVVLISVVAPLGRHRCWNHRREPSDRPAACRVAWAGGGSDRVARPVDGLLMILHW